MKHIQSDISVPSFLTGCMDMSYSNVPNSNVVVARSSDYVGSQDNNRLYTIWMLKYSVNLTGLERRLENRSLTNKEGISHLPLYSIVLQSCQRRLG